LLAHAAAQPATPQRSRTARWAAISAARRWLRAPSFDWMRADASALSRCACVMPSPAAGATATDSTVPSSARAKSAAQGWKA
jgi:hypothetical protein